ncbi:carbohydrate-binding module family 20 domain-containing protein, partial [Acinetobacter baumannii]
MAARVKCFGLLLLIVGVLSLFTVSVSGEDVIVTFVMVQHADFGQVFKIIGSGDKLGDWTPANVENMTWTPGDAWAYSTTLTKGVSYEYK